MNTYGTKQHWIPAAVLGRFRDSQSKAKKRVRENEIIIRRRGQIGLSVNKAGAICFKKGLYDINPQTAKMYGLEPQSTTDQWDYEEGLTEIIDALVKGADLIDLDYFVHVLVPYASGLFMRGLDYGERQENIDVIRYLWDKNTILTDNTVFSRIIHLQRILAIVLGAEWTLYEASPRGQFIQSDMGFCPASDHGKRCWIVPLDPKLVILIKPKKKHCIANYREINDMQGNRSASWVVCFRRGKLNDEQMLQVNENILEHSFRICIGDGLRSFKDYSYEPLSEEKNNYLISIGAELENSLEVSERVEHEFEWYTVSRIAAERLSPDKAKEIQWNRPYRGSYPGRWRPFMPFLPENLKLSPSGLCIKDNRLILSLRETVPFSSLKCSNTFESNMAQIQELVNR